MSVALSGAVKLIEAYALSILLPVELADVSHPSYPTHYIRDEPETGI